MEYFLQLTPRDPVIARDGRPFGLGQGRRMRSLDWPYPSVLAGSLRTLLGKLEGGDFTPNDIKNLQQIKIAGPFPRINNTLFFPAPKDFFILKNSDGNKKTYVTLRPNQYNNNEGSNLPKHLRPVLPINDNDIEGKPAELPAYWSKDAIVRWLSDASDRNLEDLFEGKGHKNRFFVIPEKDKRIHVKIESNSGTAEDGYLFMTEGIDLNSRSSEQDIALSVRVEDSNDFANQIKSLDNLHPFGGERRLLHWRKNDNFDDGWGIPNDLRTKFSSIKPGQGIRMVLATPAIFNKGWRPGWLNDELEGNHPKCNVKLKLISAIVDRWLPLSGWSLEKGIVGPKPIKRMVPAGSVYFFEFVEGNPTDLLDNLWLKSVCIKSQDRNDGFGLAMWGLW